MTIDWWCLDNKKKMWCDLNTEMKIFKFTSVRKIVNQKKKDFNGLIG